MDTVGRKFFAIILMLILLPAMGVVGASALLAIGVAGIHGADPIDVLRAADTSAYKYTIMIAGTGGGGAGVMLGVVLWKKLVIGAGLVSSEFVKTILTGDYGT